MQTKWSEYLDAADEALASAGIAKDDVGVKMMLNRILGMEVGMQNKIFTHFTANLEHEVKMAKENHRYDEGVVDIRGQTVRVEQGFPQTLGKDAKAFIELKHYKLGVDRGIDFGMACKMLDEKKAQNGGALYPHEGFHRSSRAIIGREQEDVRGYAMLLQKPIPAYALNPVPIFKVYRPSTGLGANVVWADFGGNGRFKDVSGDDAIKGWGRLYKDALTVCSHGPRCKHGSLCQVGRRVESKHILTGSVLPYWASIQQVVGFDWAGADGSKRVSRMKIVRVRITDENGVEQRLVGVEIAENKVNVLKNLLSGAAAGAGSSSADVKPDVKPGKGGKGKAPKRFQLGARVLVHGLQSDAARQYNNQVGKIIGWEPSNQRWNVMLSSAGNILCAREANLLMT
uniref:Uncharacterized protein n=1 Tax=Haptolina ericina TaxID=156174 RepID=A0A7S3B866_9EUKA